MALRLTSERERVITAFIDRDAARSRDLLSTGDTLYVIDGSAWHPIAWREPARGVDINGVSDIPWRVVHIGESCYPDLPRVRQVATLAYHVLENAYQRGDLARALAPRWDCPAYRMDGEDVCPACRMRRNDWRDDAPRRVAFHNPDTGVVENVSIGGDMHCAICELIASGAARRHYHVITGLPGYLPNSNELYATLASARDALRWIRDAYDGAPRGSIRGGALAWDTGECTDIVECHDASCVDHWYAS